VQPRGVIHYFSQFEYDSPTDRTPDDIFKSCLLLFQSHNFFLDPFTFLNSQAAMGLHVPQSYKKAFGGQNDLLLIQIEAENHAQRKHQTPGPEGEVPVQNPARLDGGRN
jgi:hypothetical protein